MEKSTLLYVKKICPKILKDYPQVKKIKLTFIKHEIEWTNGLHWLWDSTSKTIELVIPGNYRGIMRAKWLVLHDLYHARQIMDGRLNRSLYNVVYEGKKFKWSRSKSEFVCSKGKVVKNPPWEIEVRRRSGKVFGKKNSDLAWGA